MCVYIELNLYIHIYWIGASPGGSEVKTVCSAGATEDAGLIPGSGRAWRRAWRPTPVSLPRESYDERNMVGYSPGGPKKWDMTEHAHTHNWTTLLCTWNAVSQLHFNKIHILKIQNQRDGTGRDVGGGGLGWGTHVHPWLIHVNVWQKPQYCKVISLQLS